MSKLPYIFFFFLSFSALKAQDCDPERPPTNRCVDANVLCDLDGWCGNSGGFSATSQPNAFCGVVENNCWVSFRAFTTFLEIEITTSNCFNNNGVQAQMFFTEDCQTFQSISNCLDPAPANQSSIFLSNNLTPGTIYHIMIDGKNGDSCDFEFRVLGGATSPAAFASVQDNFEVCRQDTFILGNGLASIDAYSYSWSTDTGNFLSSPDNPTVLADTIGNYTLTVIDKPHSCIDSATLNVVYDDPPLVDIIAPDSLDCGVNMMVDLNASETEFGDGFNAEWTRFDGEVLATDLVLTDINVPGLYFLTVENATGCVSKDSVEVFNSVSFPVAFAGTDQELNCVTPSVSLNASEASSVGPNFLYNWQTENNISFQNSTSAQVEIDSAGVYYLTVTNIQNNCSTIDEVEVFLNDAVPNAIEANINSPCFNEPFGSLELVSVAGGNPPFQYIFDEIETSSPPNLSEIASGIYDLTVIDSIGCTFDTMLVVETPELIVLALGEDKTIDLGQTIRLETQLNRPMESITWTPLVCDQCEEIELQPLATDTYQVTATDSLGCSVSDQILITVIEKDKVFFPNAFSPNGDGINDFYQVFGGTDVAQMNYFRIFDRSGNQVFEQKNFLPNQIENSWDGTFRNKFLNPQVLVFVIEVEFINGKTTIYSGDITLLR